MTGLGYWLLAFTCASVLLWPILIVWSIRIRPGAGRRAPVVAAWLGSVIGGAILGTIAFYNIGLDPEADGLSVLSIPISFCQGAPIGCIVAVSVERLLRSPGSNR